MAFFDRSIKTATTTEMEALRQFAGKWEHRTLKSQRWSLYLSVFLSQRIALSSPCVSQLRMPSRRFTGVGWCGTERIKN